MSHLGDLLSAQLDGEASPAERRQVTTHLEECATCRDELSSLEETRDAVRSLPTLDLPPGLAPRRRSALRPSWVWATSGIAAAAIAVGLVMAPGEAAASFDFDTMRDQHTARVVVDPGISTVRGSVSGP